MKMLHDPAVRRELEMRLAALRPDAKHDFEAERAKCKALIDRFVSKPVDSAWPDDPSFGPANGMFASRLQAKHLNHHFTQFGV